VSIGGDRVGREVISGPGVVAGVDLGTSKTKVLAFALDGRVIASAEEEYPLETPEPGYVEQDANAVYGAAMQALHRVIGEVSLRGAEVLGIGFSSAMHGVLPVDRHGEPMGPFITWMDTRAADIAERWRADGTAAALYARTGVPMHPMLPVSKLRWLSERQPDLFKQTARFVSMKELLVYRWTGEWLVDHGIASASGLFDVFTRRWDERALDAARITAERLSTPASTYAARTDVKASVVAALGLHRSVPLVLGSSDGALANLGVGALAPTDLAATLGTSGAVRATVGNPVIDEQGRAFCYAFDDAHYIVGGSTSSAGASLQWVFELAYPDVPHERRFEHAIASIRPLADATSDVICLPFFSGERAPYWDARLRGAFVGLDLSHRREALVWAAIEGVVLALRSVERVVTEKIGTPARVLLSGGLTHSPLIRQLVADVFGIEAWLPDQPEASAFGAAMMAAKAIGAIRRLDDVTAIVSTVEKLAPDPARSMRYRDQHERYEILTRAMQAYYHRGQHLMAAPAQGAVP
jgi:gluconokinase